MWGPCHSITNCHVLFNNNRKILREAYLKKHSRMLSAFQSTFMTEPCKKSSLRGRWLISLTQLSPPDFQFSALSSPSLGFCCLTLVLKREKSQQVVKSGSRLALWGRGSPMLSAHLVALAMSTYSWGQKIPLHLWILHFSNYLRPSKQSF